VRRGWWSGISDLQKRLHGIISVKTLKSNFIDILNPIRKVKKYQIILFFTVLDTLTVLRQARFFLV
jgi:hypothetical protein